MAKKKKTKRGKTRTKGRAKVNPFARVGSAQSGPKAAPFVFKRATTSRVAGERRLVERILISRGVPTDVAHQIAYDMNPDLYYLLRIWGLYSSDPDDEGSSDLAPVLQVMYVGSGRRLWSRCINYAAKAPIQYVEIDPLDPAYGAVDDRPLWDRDSIHVAGDPIATSGVRRGKGRKRETGEVSGHGDYFEWRDRQKQGRPAKPGGAKGSTAAERRKRRKAKNAAIKRREAFNKKYRALLDTDAVAAARYLERSKRNRGDLI